HPKMLVSLNAASWQLIAGRNSYLARGSRCGLSGIGKPRKEVLNYSIEIESESGGSQIVLCEPNQFFSFLQVQNLNVKICLFAINMLLPSFSVLVYLEEVEIFQRVRQTCPKVV